jgi:hypothetical protein
MITIEEMVEKYRGTRVVIVGNGIYSTTHNFSNYAEKCGEPASIWTLNGGQAVHESSELEFRMDDLYWAEVCSKERLNEKQHEIYMEMLKNPPITVFVSAIHAGYNNCIEYPLKKILTALLSVRPARAYFGESISYAILFAIFCGVKQIDFYGTDYIGEDRAAGRQCAEYWSGLANGLGIATTVHEKCNFLKTNFSESFPEESKKRGMVDNFYGYNKETLEKALEKVA